MKLVIIEAALTAIAWLVSKIKTRAEWDEVIAWFKSHEALKAGNPNLVAFTMVEPSGEKLKVIQGFFDQSTKVVVDGQMWTVESLDEQFATVHAGDRLVVYE